MGFFDELVNGNVWSNMHELNLDWVLRSVKEAVEEVAKQSKDIQTYKETMDEEFQKLKETQEQQFGILRQDWNELLEELINNVIPQLVRFEISADGRLVAWIPTQWDRLRFFTDTSDASDPDFGRLQIFYDGQWKRYE